MVIVLFRRVWFSISHVTWTYASGDPVVVWATRWETSIVHWRTYDQVTPSLSLVTTVHLHSLLHPTGCTQTHIRVERLGKETCCWLLKGRQHLIFLCCVGRSTKKPRQLQIWWWKKRGTDTRALARLQTQDDATKNRGKPGSSFLAIYHISSCLSCTSKEIACKLVCAHFSFARASLWSCPSACCRDLHCTCTILHGARARVVAYGNWRNWLFSRSSFDEHCQLFPWHGLLQDYVVTLAMPPHMEDFGPQASLGFKPSGDACAEVYFDLIRCVRVASPA
jgi:hypothetical protein